MNNLVVNGLITRTIDFAGNGLEILKADLRFGVSAEEQVINRLNVAFKDDIVGTKELYQDPQKRWDAESMIDKTKYEIKTRRNTLNKYPTTIIPVHKTEVGGRIVFVFNFTDKLSYIVYDAQRFSEYEIKDIRAVRKGGHYTLLPHYCIPVGDLTILDI
jgi:hypothetical protein